MISAQHHFGPEPKLLETNNLSSSRQKAIFRPLGSYAAHTNAINFRIPFAFGKFLYDFTAARSNMTKYTNRVNSYSQDKFNRIAKLHKDTLTDLQQEYLDIISVLPTKAPTSPNQSRTKRFFGIAIATASLGVSLANRYSITKLESQMSNLEEKTDMLVKIEHVNQNHLKQVDDRLANIELLMSQIIADDSAMVVKTCDYIEKHFQQGNNMVRDVIASAMNHRLAPGALHISAMNDIIDHIKSVADKKGYINFINSPADLYQVEVSSVYYPQTKTFALILHAPIIHPDNLMTLSQYIPLPLVHNHTANITLTPDTRGVDILAMGSTQLYNTLTASDLANCLHLGNTFFCKGRRELRTDIENSCLTALYFGMADRARTQCQFRITATKEQVFELQENVWAVYTQGTIATNQVCPGKQTEAIRINSGDVVKVKPGCAVRTVQHVLVADEISTIDIDADFETGRWELDQFFPEHPSKAVTDAIESLRNQGRHNVDTGDLLLQLDNLQKADSHWTFSFPALLILATILIGSGILAYCCFCKKGSTTPTPSAPPAYPGFALPTTNKNIPVTVSYG